MDSIRRSSWCVAACLALVLAPNVFAENEDELRAQQEKQRQVQMETDQVVRRITTMLRVMQFYEVKSAEEKIMKEMSGTLAGLSKNQMEDVIRQLQAAATSKDEKQAEAIDKALDSHHKVLDALREMNARFDAVKSLEDAAQRFEQHAKEQVGLHLLSGDALRDLIDSASTDLSPTARVLINKRMFKQISEMKRQSDLQSRLFRDVSVRVKQVQQLAPKLNVEQQACVQAMDKLIGAYRLLENLDEAAKKLFPKGGPKMRQPGLETGHDLQWKNANQLQELARVLRQPSDALAILMAARAQIDDAIAKQEGIKEEIKVNEDKIKEAQAKKEADQPKDPKEKLVIPGLEQLPTIKPEQVKVAEAKALADKAIENAASTDKNVKLAEKQAQIAFATKDTANQLKPLAPEAVKALESAETSMKNAKENLLKNEPAKAADPQAKATDKLKNAKAEIDKMIAAAEKAKVDPLAALKNTIEKLDNIIKEQTKTRADTKETVGEKQNLKVPELANTQKELAKKTDAVKNTPLPNPEKVEAALNKATEAMKAAAKNLEAKESPEAVAKQDKAIENLKEARNELADKAAEIEKRRDDIAKLEDADKKLGELAKEEKNVAKEADKNANQPKADPAANKELAKEQGALTPKANEIAKEIDKAAPKAAEKIAASTKNMEAAKKGLDKNEAKPAASEAKEAAKKLDDAQKALKNALADLKGKEAADEIAMKKNTDPAAAAQQIAKAIEETQKAAEAAKAADQPMNADAKGDLAKQQAEIAKQASDAKLPEAATPAAKAAEALKNGDIPKALENQAKALEQLQDAAKNNPMPQGDPMKGDPMAKQGEAKAGEAKEGDQPAQAKENTAQPAEAKGAEPMAKGDPMKGEAKAAAPKQAQNPKKGDQPMAQAKGDQPKGQKGEKPMAQAKGDQPMQGEPKQGEAQTAQAKQGDKGEQPLAQAKAGGEQPMAKGDPMAGQKGDQPMAQAKGQQGEKGQSEKGQGQEGHAPAQLAKQQKAVMDATKALAQSQDATQAAQAALAQAQAQAPQAIQPQLQKAQEQLQQAQQQLQQAQPGKAGEAQQQAAENLGQALQALNKALAQAGLPQAEPGQPGTAQGDPMTAKAEPGQGGKGEKGEKGMGEGEGQAKGEKGKGEAPGQAKGEKGKSNEKNEAKGEGNRQPNGKLNNAKAQLNNVSGDGTFMHLPPRQRELIRQAISGNLPPEYANLIQQYYINIARGRAATGSAPSAPPPR
jgi:hypothetical protein